MSPVEMRQLWQVVLALATLSAFVLCYVRGGRSHRVIRWLGGGLSLACGGTLLSLLSRVWHPMMLLAWLSYPLALSLGYGGSTTATKLLRRTLAGLAMGLASAPVLLPLGLGWVLVLQTGLAMLVSVSYGLTNPMSAVGEEGQLAASYWLFVPWALIR